MRVRCSCAATLVDRGAGLLEQRVLPGLERQPGPGRCGAIRCGLRSGFGSYVVGVRRVAEFGAVSGCSLVCPACLVVGHGSGQSTPPQQDGAHRPAGAAGHLGVGQGRVGRQLQFVPPPSSPRHVRIIASGSPSRRLMTQLVESRVPCESPVGCAHGARRICRSVSAGRPSSNGLRAATDGCFRGCGSGRGGGRKPPDGPSACAHRETSARWH